MALPSVYINLEDDVSKVAARVKKEKADSLVLVCPKRCQLFSDSINLRLLKKQAELLKKEIFILTMDERGQLYAKEAGFALKFLPKSQSRAGFSDISARPKPLGFEEVHEGGFKETVKSVTNFVSGLVLKKKEEENNGEELSLKAETVIEPPEILNIERKIDLGVNKARGAIDRLKPKLKVDKKTFDRDAANKAGSKKRQGLALSLALALSLIVILGLVFVILPQATIVIYPKSEPVTRDFDVSLDSEAQEVDAFKLVLPGTKVDESLESTAKFKSQGKKDVGNKAAGSVRIYNFTGQILNLKAQTTQLVAGTKIYNLSEDALQIRPTKYKNTGTKEIDEDSLNEPFEIAASAGGEDSNLPAGIRLEITNQIFGSRPQIVYAKSETPISGGTSRFLSVVSQSDIDSAQTQLAKQLFEQVQAKLAAKNLMLAENGFKTEIIAFNSDKPAGAESPSFEASLKIKITGLAFSPLLLKELVTRRISQQLSENRRLKTDKDFNLQYKFRPSDTSIYFAVLSVHFEGKTVMNVDLRSLPPQLIGKSKEQGIELLQTMDEIEKADINLSPSWQNNFPWFTSKIKVNLAE